MKRRILLLLLCAALLACMAPAVLTASAMEVEGDWTTYLFANEYDESPDVIYRPEAGYRYTDEGLSTVSPDFLDYTPAVSVMTKEKQSVKEGIYLQFRVDDFSYGGNDGADEWIALTLSTEAKVCPGSTAYGGGWMNLIRGKGDGNCTSQAFLTDPQADGSTGSFAFLGQRELSIPQDDQGREIYTLEITWDGTAYEMKLNGVTADGGEEATALLEELDPNGEFFLGISMQAMVKNGTADLTILKYGTCEADATTPIGDDSKEPGDGGCIWPILPEAIPLNQPAILWSPATTPYVDLPTSPVAPEAWQVTATDEELFLLLQTMKSQYCSAEDFPVFGVMLRDLWVDGGTLHYAAGDVTTPREEYSIPFSIHDGELYEDRATGKGYVFIPINLADLWAGRVHSVGLHMQFLNPDHRTFDLCFAGLFRSVDEAYAYAENYLVSMDVIHATPPVTEALANTEPTEEDSFVYPLPSLEETEAAPEGNIEDPALQDVMEKYGCTAALAGSMLLPLLLGAMLLRKKERE